MSHADDGRGTYGRPGGQMRAQTAQSRPTRTTGRADGCPNGPIPTHSDDRAGKWVPKEPDPDPHARPGGQMGAQTARSRPTRTTGRADAYPNSPTPTHTHDRAGIRSDSRAGRRWWGEQGRGK